VSVTTVVGSAHNDLCTVHIKFSPMLRPANLVSTVSSTLEDDFFQLQVTVAVLSVSGPEYLLKQMRSDGAFRTVYEKTVMVANDNDISMTFQCHSAYSRDLIRIKHC
jgi:hypothetical protein